MGGLFSPIPIRSKNVSTEPCSDAMRRQVSGLKDIAISMSWRILTRSAAMRYPVMFTSICRRILFGRTRPPVRRQAFFPVVLPHSAMLPNKVCCDLSLFYSTSGDEVWRRGRHLSPLLQQLALLRATFSQGNGSGLCGDAGRQGMTWRAQQLRQFATSGSSHERQTGGCCRSTELAIVALKRS